MAKIDSQTTLGSSELNAILQSILTDLTNLKAAALANQTAVAELHDDHATFKTVTTDLKTQLNAAIVDIGAVRTKLLATHAKLDLDAGVTDTDYASANNPAALTSAAVTSSAPATLSATKPSAPSALVTS